MEETNTQTNLAPSKNKGSAILRINDELNRLRSPELKLNIIDLGIGNPKHAISDAAKKKMKEVADSGEIPYGGSAGLNPLRDTIAQSTNDDLLYTNFNRENVVVTSGSNSALYALQSKFKNEKDFLSLILTPAYASYLPAIYGNGGIPVAAASLNKGFKPNIENIEKCFVQAEAKGKKIKSIIINYPNNPTGAVLTKEEANALADYLNKKAEEYRKSGDRFVVILDEVYKHLVFGEKEDSSSIYPFLSEELREDCVILGSASKTSALAGERVGYAVSSNKDLINGIISESANIMISPSTAAQHGFEADLKAITKERIEEISGFYRNKALWFSCRLTELAYEAGWETPPVEDVPEGGMFVYANLSEMIGKKIPKEMVEIFEKDVIENDEDIARYLMLIATTKDGDNNRVGVATIPGSGFLSDPKEGYVRICISGEFNKTMEHDTVLPAAIDAIKNAMEYLKNAQIEKPNTTISVNENKPLSDENREIVSRL